MKNTFETMELAPAVRLCSYETDRFTTSRLSVSIAVPLDPAAISANTVMRNLLVRSSEDYPSVVQFRKKLESLYGAALSTSIAKHGDTQVLRFALTIVDNKFAFDGEDISLLAAEFLFGLLFKPNFENGVFCLEELEKEKRLAIEALITAKNDKRLYAFDRCLEEMFRGEAYGSNALGTEDGIAALTPEDVYTAYVNMIRGGRVQINAVGNIDASKIADLFMSYLDKISRAPYMMFTAVQYEAENIKKVTELMPLNQGKLVIGLRAGITDPDEDYAKARIMTDIFGGGTYSRLFMNVREKMSLCYYCSARYLKEKGIIVVQSGVEGENADVAVDAICDQLKDIANGNVTKEDLDASHRSLTDTYKTICDMPETIDNWFFSCESDDVVESPDEYIAKLTAVTIDDVIEAAKRVTVDTVYILRNPDEEVE